MKILDQIQLPVQNDPMTSNDSNLGALAGLCAGAAAKSWPAANFREWQM